MSPRVGVRPVAVAERGVIDDMARRYYAEVLPNGPLYHPRMLDRYWSEAGRHPYLVEVDGAPAGFALVWNHDDGTHELAEFTVRPEFRHQGIGTQAALLVFESLGGAWTVGVSRHVPQAMAFWDSCLHGAQELFDIEEGPPRTGNQSGSFTFRVAR